MSGENVNVSLPQAERLSHPWRFKGFAVSFFILLVGFGWFFAHQVRREPIYHGKALTIWLATYGSSRSSPQSQEWKETDDAVRHLGTNCIPVLLRMIGEKDSRLKLRLLALAKKQSLMKISFIPASVRNVQASRAFIVLGERGKEAVPALVKLCDKNISTDSQSAIADALAWIGPAAKPALPLLLRAATNSTPKVRANALWALGEITAEPQSCVPLLTRSLSDPDSWTRLSAAHALGMFGTNAQSAIPFLVQLTQLTKVSSNVFSYGTMD